MIIGGLICLFASITAIANMANRSSSKIHHHSMISMAIGGFLFGFGFIQSVVSLIQAAVG
jgi:hypothetical protein